ncbi:MAG: HAMP domain-containing protein [Clostridia bacterium]|nr:HAMP domain-containing protein [Clostridia bacterium]
MNKSLYSKIILILVVFIITVMSVVAVVLLNNIYSYYSSDFTSQMESSFDQNSQLYIQLESALSSENYAAIQKEVLLTYSSILGIDSYRNFYILGTNGEYLESSNSGSNISPEKTPNLISAIGKKTSGNQSQAVSYTDYALYIEGAENSCIIYIKDTQEDMRQLSWILFTIILQSILIGLVIAIIMAFFLSKAITAPIQSLTKGAKLVAAGDFSHKIEVHSKDEIGVLTNTFNHMKKMLKTTIDEVSGERQKLETVFSHLQAGVITFTDEGKVLNINPFAKDLLGEKFNERFNIATLLDLFDIQSATEDGSGEMPDEQNVIYDEVVFASKVLEVNFGGIRYNDGGEMRDGIITVIHDVTSRYELEKSRREFVANVSHELRTPLTSIKGACETVLEHPELPDEIKNKLLEMTVSESNRMTGIVKDLLTLSRLDNKRTKWQIVEYDINDSLQHLCDVMNVDATAHNHKLILQADETLPKITADKDRIDQVIVNIISNAIKYTPEGGTIVVGSSMADKNNILIRIIDNGLGIPEKDIPRIFERFYRVEKARTSDTGGTGLGLAIAKELIEAHGGSIDIQSRLNVGTMVDIKLPVKTKLESESGD